MAKRKSRLYLDYSASAPLLEAAKNAMMLAAEIRGNPSSSHEAGRDARAVIEVAREQVAALLGGSAHHVVFTSGATESNNQILTGLWLRHLQQQKPFRLVISTIEHSSIRNTAAFLEKMGSQVHRLPVGANGLVRPADLHDILARFPADLVSIMSVNNETGAIQPIAELLALSKAAGVAFHTDAVQAVGKIAMSYSDVDYVSISAHKLGGPKGVGALLLKDPTHCFPLIRGGGHEQTCRSGTENLMGIAGFGAACADWRTFGDRYRSSAAALKHRFQAMLSERCSFTLPDTTPQSDFVCNVFTPALDGQAFMMKLDLDGIDVSTGSACATGSIEPSPVLAAMGVSAFAARNAIRISWGPGTPDTAADTLARYLDCYLSRGR